MRQSREHRKRALLSRRPAGNCSCSSRCCHVVVALFLLTLALLEPVSARPRCLYKVLGVPKTCSPTDLKKAYRKAALLAHPDKGGDEETFKELSQAYEVLSDPELRQRYDRFGHAGIGGSNGADAAPPNPFQQQGGFDMGGGRPSGPENPEFANFFREFANQAAGAGAGAGRFFGTRPNHQGTFGLDDWLRQMMMGGGGSGPAAARTRRQPRPLKEVTRTLTCTLADLFLGKTKTVTLQINGQRGGGGTPQRYSIKLKPGWKVGTKIKFPQRGRYIPPITFVIQEAKHATLVRRDNDLVYRHKVSGKKRKRKVTKDVRLSITLPDGQVWQRTVPAERVPTLLKPGVSLTVPDMGMPIKDTNERGNLIIEFY